MTKKQKRQASKKQDCMMDKAMPQRPSQANSSTQKTPSKTQK